MTLFRLDVVESEIARIRRRHLALLDELREAPATWELHEDALCWYVVLRGVDEPDIDLEILPDAIIVRAAVEETLRQTVLPIPEACRAAQPLIRVRAETVEVRLFVRVS